MLKMNIFKTRVDRKILIFFDYDCMIPAKHKLHKNWIKNGIILYLILKKYEKKLSVIKRMSPQYLNFGKYIRFDQSEKIGNHQWYNNKKINRREF